MRWLSSILALTALLPALAWTGARADEGVLHTFTNKKGDKIEAELLDVSRDRRSIRIRRADGAEFESEIVLFSLDDQQHIKDWLAERDAAANYALELSVSKKLDRTERRRNDDYRIDTGHHRYEVTLRNLSRDTLANAKIRYALVREETVEPVEQDDGSLTYRISRGARASGLEAARPPRVSLRVALRGEIALDTLAYNHSASLLTGAAPLDKVSHGRKTLYEDSLLGAVVQVVSSTGEILGESRTGTSEVTRMNWEEIAELRTEEAEAAEDTDETLANRVDLLSVVGSE